MIEKTKTVKSAEWKETKDGTKQYLSAVLLDENGRGSTQAVFEPDLQKVIEEAYKASRSLLVGIEKEGQFWNIKTATLGEPVATPQTPRTEGKYSSKDDDILLAVAFKGAVELESNLVPEAQPNAKRVLLTTTELYMGLLLLRGRALDELRKEVK